MPFILSDLRMHFAEDARLCIFGRHISKPDRCSLILLDSKGEDKLVAETDNRDNVAVACLNGEFVFSF